MTKAEFLDRLCQGLRFCPDPEEIQRTVNFYAEAIDDRIEDGMTEEEAVAAMGGIDEIVAEMRSSWRPASEDGARAENRRVFSAAAVRRIDVFDTTGEVDIRPSPDADIHIEYTASDRWRYEISGEETVTVRRLKLVGREDTVNIGLFGRSFTVSLPHFDRVLTVEPHLKLLIPADSPVAVNVIAGSGDVECREVSLGGLAVKLAGGDLTVSGTSSAGKVELGTVSGDIEVQDLSAPEVNVNTVSGELTVEGLAAAGLTLRSVSGDVEAENLSVAQRLTVGSVSGDIDADLDAPCERISADTVSGDVELSLPGGRGLYTILTQSHSGNVYVPDPTVAGPDLVRLKSMSGNLSVVFT